MATVTKTGEKSAPARKKRASAPAKAPPAVEPPFRTFEEFLFQVLTLRSSAAYRTDVQALAGSDDDDPPWYDRLALDTQPFNSAQNIISTWDLICSVVTNHYATPERKAIFFENTPLAAMYVWMQAPLAKIKSAPGCPSNFARYFIELGDEAFKSVGPTFVPKSDVDSASSAQTPFLARLPLYRTAWRKMRPFTHFG